MYLYHGFGFLINEKSWSVEISDKKNVNVYVHCPENWETAYN